MLVKGIQTSEFVLILISFEIDFFTCQIGSLELNRHGKEIRSFTCHKSNAFSKLKCTVKHIYLVTAESDNGNIKGDHSFATRSLQNESGKQEGAD